MATLLIAEDHSLVRQGIRLLLEAENDIQIIGEASDGNEVLPMVRDLKPDVLLLDIHMPGKSGLELAHALCSAGCLTGVVIFSVYFDLRQVHSAYRAGINAYLLKDSSAEELVAAVSAARRGERYISPFLADRLGIGMDALTRLLEDDFIGDHLTPRERQVWQLIAQGLTNQAIAHELDISTKTVEKHRGNLMKKLGVNDVASLVRLAVQHGMIFLGD